MVIVVRDRGGSLLAPQLALIEEDFDASRTQGHANPVGSRRIL